MLRHIFFFYGKSKKNASEHSEQRQWDLAIADRNKAAVNPELVEAYPNRGGAYKVFV